MGLGVMLVDHYPDFTLLLMGVNSTAACCIVRTVLNNESIPIDKTCGVSFSDLALYH